DVQEWLDEAWRDGVISDALLLRDRSVTDSGAVVLSDFDETSLEYADNDRGPDGTAADVHPAHPVDYVRLNLFVRLWRKLGWSIEETDQALQAFVPKTSWRLIAGAGVTLGSAPIGEVLKTVLVYLGYFEHLEEALKPGKGSRLKLIALWGDLPTA